MMAVADETGPQVIVGQLFPDVVVMAGQYGMRAVPQVRGQPRAGGHGITKPHAGRCRMTQRDDDTAGRQSFDELESALVFRCQRDQTNAAAGCLLEATELVPAGRTDMA